MGEPRFSLERKNFVLNLAKSITEKQDAKVPGLLLRLKSVLDEHVTMKGLAVRREILEYNLLKVLILILRQDYSVIDGQWETAAELAVILSNVICGLSVDESCRKKLEKEDLPKSIESILLLARHVYIILEASSRKQITSTEKQNTTRTLKIVIDSLLAICSTYTYLVASVLSSQWFLQLLVSDNADVAIITMTALEELVILDLDFPTKIDHNLLFTLLDELIYKLTVNTDLRIAMKASKCLLKFCDSQRHLVDSLCARYIGFYPLLKRWDGKGFDRELRQLTNILESGSCSTAQQQKQKECAVLIQATYRGYSTRKKLTRANNAFSKFHKTYRRKKEKQETDYLQTQYQSELYHQMKLKRQQILRKLHEKKLQELDILLASEVERFLNNEKAVAATNIQTVWRGHRERSRLKERQYITKQVHAAITIQRKIRKWLDKKAVSKQTLPGYLKPSGLTDERKMKLYHQIRQWQQQNPPNVKSKEELETVHMFAQNELSRHYSHIRPYRNLEQQVESLTARLNTDMELVQLAPDLDSASMSDIDMYSCKPLPIKTAAKLLHSQTLKELQQPWWKTLVKQDFEEYYDKKEEAEAEAHLQTLGI